LLLGIDRLLARLGRIADLGVEFRQEFEEGIGRRIWQVAEVEIVFFCQVFDRLWVLAIALGELVCERRVIADAVEGAVQFIELALQEIQRIGVQVGAGESYLIIIIIKIIRDVGF